MRGGTLDAMSASMADLARVFSALVGRTVVDKAGITGTFPVHLTFAPEDSIARPADPPSVDAAAPNIFTAIEEQLGLKLKSAKGPMDVLVIDHADKPSEN